MRTDNVADFVLSVDLKRFLGDPDFLMKNVEKDHKLIAWISWSQELLFNGLSYKEMYDYIGKVTENDLDEFIKLVAIHIEDEKIEGVLLDMFYALYENGEVKSLLNLENQINPYPYEEKIARGVYYVDSMIFWEKGNIKGINKDNYKNLKPANSIWIFPDDRVGPTNLIKKYPLKSPEEEVLINCSKTKIQSEILEPKFFLDNNIYQYYLGDYKDLNINQITNNTKKEEILVFLLDLVFGVIYDSETRLTLLERNFNLTSEFTKNEVKYMEAYQLYAEEFGKEQYKEGLKKGRADEKSYGKEQYKEGLKEGRAEKEAFGKDQYSNGEKEGVKKGLKEGVKKGLEEGLKEGAEKTEQHFLKTVVEKLKKEDPSLSEEEVLLKAKNLLGISN